MKVWPSRNLVIAVVLLAVVIVALELASVALSPIKAQDTAPAWEYAALAYDGDTAFAYTNDQTANNEINEILDNIPDDQLNSIAALNVMGANGWEYIDYQPGSTVVYMFKRPLE